MNDAAKTKAKPRSSQRFDREAEALQKNLAKRKTQQKKREQLKSKQEQN